VSNRSKDAKVTPVRKAEAVEVLSGLMGDTPQEKSLFSGQLGQLVHPNISRKEVTDKLIEWLKTRPKK
jgi:hypothetical protein